MRIIKAVFLAAAIAACGGGGKKGGDTTTTTAKAEAAIELGEITIFEGDEAQFKIHADGSTEVGGTHNGAKVMEPGPTLKADGTIEAKGKAVARVNADGSIVNLEDNTAFPVAITADKFTITHEGKQMGMDLAANGGLTIFGGEGKGPDKPLRVEGADTPGKRRTVLAMLSLVLLPGHLENAPPTTSVEGGIEAVPPVTP